ncbi:MAG: protein-export chaperone SecB [Gammaproteobacteria bacterium]|nr:protein-export chaperone SecB [Gammaproteobacteria bacterium]
MTEEAATATKKEIAIQKIYIKDFSFESPSAPMVFQSSDWTPKTNLNLRSSHTKKDGGLHEIVLTITAETKHDDKTIFLVELQQAGLFHIGGYEGEEFAAIVGSFCPNVLFPYAREMISSAVAKGGFPEFMLQPINFDALYMQSRQQAAAQAAQAGSGGDGSNGGSH